MPDDKAMDLMKEVVKSATERHNKRIHEGRYQETDSDDSFKQIAELIANGDRGSKEYANSLVYEMLKILLEKNPHLLDDPKD